MKSLPEHFKQALSALEFANAGHLAALTAALDRHEADPAAGRDDTGAGRDDESPAPGNAAP